MELLFVETGLKTCLFFCHSALDGASIFLLIPPLSRGGQGVCLWRNKRDDPVKPHPKSLPLKGGTWRKEEFFFVETHCCASFLGNKSDHPVITCMNTRFATPPYKRRGSKIVEFVFVETGLRPVFFYITITIKLVCFANFYIERYEWYTLVEKYSYNSDGRIKQYVKSFFGELLNTCGDTGPGLFWHTISLELGHLYDHTIGYNSDEYRAEGYLDSIYYRYWNNKRIY